MKAKVTLFCVVFSLLIAVIGLCGDFHAYTDQTKTVPQGEGGIVFSITTFDGATESEPFVSCLGHTWLSVENRTGHPISLQDYKIENGEAVTFSIWAIAGHRGVMYNLEANFIRQYHRYVGRQSLSVRIDESQVKTIEEYIRSNDNWTLGKNCSRWSLELWNRVVDEPDRLKTQTLIYMPKRLQKSFREFDCVERDKDFSGAKEIFFYENGVRTELQLCS